MNTQFNSNVIWLQLEYKISTLEILFQDKLFLQLPDYVVSAYSFWDV